MDELEKLHAEYVSYLPLKAEDEKRLWTKLRLDWNYNSNRIEGNTLTYGETVARKEIIPGEYKTLQNHVTLRGGGLHKFAEPHEVPARMEDTISLIRDFIGSPNAPLPVFLASLECS